MSLHVIRNLQVNQNKPVQFYSWWNTQGQYAVHYDLGYSVHPILCPYDCTPRTVMRKLWSDVYQAVLHKQDNVYYMGYAAQRPSSRWTPCSQQTSLDLLCTSSHCSWQSCHVSKHWLAIIHHMQGVVQLTLQSHHGWSCRYEFQTEEEWQQYKETREQLPKAAFQFGVKRSDGRKSQKDLNASGGSMDGKQKDQKLDTQLKKIERLLTDKGHEHTSAFAKPPPLVSFTPFRDDGTGDGPAPKRKRL